MSILPHNKTYSNLAINLNSKKLLTKSKKKHQKKKLKFKKKIKQKKLVILTVTV